MRGKGKGMGGGRDAYQPLRYDVSMCTHIGTQ